MQAHTNALTLHLGYQGFQSEKRGGLQHVYHLSIRQMPEHCCWKCCANQGIVFKDCIFTSPETDQSQVIPDASLYFDFVAFHSNCSFTVETASPLLLSCNGVQHSQRTIQQWDWACRSVETLISLSQGCGMPVLLLLVHYLFLLHQCWQLSSYMASWLATSNSKLCSRKQLTLQLQEQQFGH